MNVRRVYQARHAAAHRAGPAKIAGTAVALALGAVPLAATAAQADAAPQTALPLTGAALALEGTVSRLGDGGSAGPVDGVFHRVTGKSADQFTSALPVSTLAHQVVREQGGETLIASDVLHQGTLAALSQELAPHAANVASGMIGQARPLVGRLHGNGVPTVGDVATRVGSTSLPSGTTVGAATDALPVSSLVDKAPPVADTLANASLL